MAPLVDNKFFLRAAPERRAPVHGCVDKNLLGCDFYVNVPTYELFIKSRGGSQPRGFEACYWINLFR
jgi:hypothetical protein